MVNTLKAKKREIKGRENDQLRKIGVIPAVLYGNKIKNLDISVLESDFDTIWQQAGASSLVDLNVEGNKGVFNVLINDVARDPITGKVSHIDFYQPDLTKEIEAKVPLAFFGESLAVKDLAGTLVKNISELTLKALPQKLPREIKVNIAKLKTYDDAITVGDLELPEGVKILKNPSEIVALAVPAQKVEEELEKPIEEKVEEVEQVEKEKKDVVTEEEAEGKIQVKTSAAETAK